MAAGTTTRMSSAFVFPTFFIMSVAGGLVGTLPTEQHRVSGELYIVDSKTIFIEDFNYDGGGPGEYCSFTHYTKMPMCSVDYCKIGILP